MQLSLLVPSDRNSNVSLYHFCFCCCVVTGGVLQLPSLTTASLATGQPPALDVPCPTGMFRCAEGKCIPSLWVCNYQRDCEKGEDEFQSCRKCIQHSIVLYAYALSPRARARVQVGACVRFCTPGANEGLVGGWLRLWEADTGHRPTVFCVMMNGF